MYNLWLLSHKIIHWVVIFCSCAVDWHCLWPDPKVNSNRTLFPSLVPCTYVIKYAIVFPTWLLEIIFFKYIFNCYKFSNFIFVIIFLTCRYVCIIFFFFKLCSLLFFIIYSSNLLRCFFFSLFETCFSYFYTVLSIFRLSASSVLSLFYRVVHDWSS